MKTKTESILDKERVDIIEVEGDKYVVDYDSNSLNDSVDARVVDYSNRFFLDGNDPSLGANEALDESVAQDPEEAIKYLESEYGTGSEGESDVSWDTDLDLEGSNNSAF